MARARMPGMHVEAGGGADVPTPWGEIAVGKVSGRQTGGAFSLDELAVTSGWSRPAYVHHEVDECFYVVEGTFAVDLDDGGDGVDVGAGAVLFVPRGAARSLRCTSLEGRLLVLQTPGRPLDPAAPLAGVESVQHQSGQESSAHRA